MAQKMLTAKPRSWLRLFGRLVVAGLMLGVLAGAGALMVLGYFYNKYSKDPTLPSLENLNKTAKVLTKVLDRNGVEMCEIGAEKRITVRYTNFPPHLVNAVIAVEDRTFRTHSGVDYKAIARAFYRNWRAGKHVQGGSTITQQVIKNYLLSAEKSYERKGKEVILAWRLEEKYSKDEILEMYLNRINYDRGRYGVETAAQYYFGKHVGALTLAEAALLAGIPKNPSKFNPRRCEEKEKGKRECGVEARTRRRVVLAAMRAVGTITGAEFVQADAEPFKLAPPSRPGYETWLEVCDYARQTLEEKHCKGLDKVRCEQVVSELGVTVHTTIDARLQEATRRFLEEGVTRVGSRHKRPAPQGAVVVLHPHTREVLAIVGGAPYVPGGLNRALQGKRQPGSLFKAFPYAAGFESGAFNSGSIFTDQLTCFPMGAGQPDWCPQNYEPEFRGDISVHTAFVHSVNTVAAQAIQRAGVDATIEMAHTVGITSSLNRNFSLALGTSEVTPMEIANSYATFVAGGKFGKPIIISSIGTELPKRPPLRQVIPTGVADAMVSLMHGVVEEGTGMSARGKLPQRSGGKTGTTSDHSDAWFAGFTQDLVTVVWVGHSAGRVFLGSKETGARAALPIWLDTMHFALTGKPKGAVYAMPKQATASEEAADATGALEGDVPQEESEDGVEKGEAEPQGEEVIKPPPSAPAETPPTPAPTEEVPAPSSEGVEEQDAADAAELLRSLHGGQ